VELPIQKLNYGILETLKKNELVKLIQNIVFSNYY